MNTIALLASSGDATDLKVYGIAAFPMALMLGVIRWCIQQMGKKDEVIEKLNERLIVQGDQAIRQAEKLAPLITDASRVLNQAIDELAPRFDERRR